tara:strand:- start:174 stop:338 length:165 start_codon:yes stop_codon:yes gene_type:complete
MKLTEQLNTMKKLLKEEKKDKGLLDGLKEILRKQKEAHAEDRWYKDIVDLIKNL